MTRDSKRVDAKGDVEDRISALPSNLIDHIIKMLPVHDAARTSILSKHWRYVWNMLPNLVFDKHFCNKLVMKSNEFVFKTIDEILLLHRGDIVKFDLDISGVNLYSPTYVDRWMHYVTVNGVKELILNMSRNTTYKVPSYIFNCLTMTRLKLINCVFKAPDSFIGFQNLTVLHLEKITFVPTIKFCVIKAPLLLVLGIISCSGTQYLNIVVSSGLNWLVVYQNHYNFGLNCFANCQKLTYLSLVVNSPISVDARSAYEKLMLSLSSVKTLILDSFVMELLTIGTVTKRLPFTLNCLWHLSLSVNFGQIGQISYAVELIKSSPNLSELLIWVYEGYDSSGEVMKYLEKPTCLDRPLDKLKRVVIHHFDGSKGVLLFIKLLFARTPSLVRMDINQNKALGMMEERIITKELMRFPRASPKAELVYSINAA